MPGWPPTEQREYTCARSVVAQTAIQLVSFLCANFTSQRTGRFPRLLFSLPSPAFSAGAAIVRKLVKKSPPMALGIYDCYCYLPLYIFCDRHLLAAKLRRSNIDASAGAVEEVARIVGHLRARWPRVRILLRADAGFAREELMHWCEHNSVDFLFGLAKNARLTAAIAAELAAARQHSEQTGKPARRFKDFTWSTLDSWSRTRRVIGKAEWTGGEANPRFVVTSLARSEHEARHLYEKVYCARGDMENRIKECQLDLFADRTSATTMRANQLRLWFAAMAYVLVCALRRVALRHTQFAEATCGTIRLKLFKIGALVRVSVRRIKIAMASACPYQNEFALAHLRLTATAH